MRPQAFTAATDRFPHSLTRASDMVANSSAHFPNGSDGLVLVGITGGVQAVPHDA
jgi:hypothetical protein